MLWIKRLLVFIVLTFLISSLISSCSIKKRKYRDGYYISFHKHNKESKQNTIKEVSHEKSAIYSPAEKLTDTTDVFNVTDKKALPDKLKKEAGGIKEMPAITRGRSNHEFYSDKANRETREKLNKDHQSPTIRGEDQNAKIFDDPEDTEKPRVFTTYSILSFVVALLAFFLTLIMILNPITMGILVLGLFFGVCLSFLAIVLAIVAFAQIKSKLNNYKGRRLAITAIIIASIAALISLAIIIYFVTGSFGP